MKNGRMILAIALIAAIAVGIGIHAFTDPVSADSLAQALEEETKWKIGRMDEILDDHLNMPLEELPTEWFFLLSNYAGDRYIHLNLNSIGNTLHWFTHSTKESVNNIQRIDSEHIAAVYKVSEEDIPEAYMYIVFQRDTSSDPSRESWEKTGEAYFFDRLHCFAEYSNISVGEKVDVLYNIDPSIQYDVLRKELSVDPLDKTADGFSKSKSEYNLRMIYKLLSDGILLIEYKLDDMLITEINFYPYSESAELDYISIKNAEPLACLAEIGK